MWVGCRAVREENGSALFGHIVLYVRLWIPTVYEVRMLILSQRRASSNHRNYSCSIYHRTIYQFRDDGHDDCCSPNLHRRDIAKGASRHDDYDSSADDHIRSTGSFSRELWNTAHSFRQGLANSSRFAIYCPGNHPGPPTYHARVPQMVVLPKICDVLPEWKLIELL